MDSKDIRIVINGQEFIVDGDVLRPAEQSNFQQEVITRLGRIESRLGTLDYEQRLLHSKIDGLQTSVYWTLAAIGIFLAALGIPAVIASITGAFRKSERSQPDTQSITNSLIDAFAKGLAAGRKEGQ